MVELVTLKQLNPCYDRKKQQSVVEQTSKYKSKFESQFADNPNKKKLSLPMKHSALTMKLLAPKLTLYSTILLLKRRGTSQRKIDENILRLRRNDPT